MRSDSFEDFFRAEYPGVVRAVRYVVGDHAVAEELAQGAFVSLLRHWDKVSRYERPDLWVRTVAMRDAARERRRSWRRPALEKLAAGPAVHEATEPRPDVWQAVGSLPPRQRAVVVLFYYEDRPMPEIASILGCSESTGWSQLSAARVKLAALLGEEVTDDVR